MNWPPSSSAAGRAISYPNWCGSVTRGVGRAEASRARPTGGNVPPSTDVVGRRVEAPHEAHVGPRHPRPDGRVHPSSIEVPAPAAAGVPDGVAKPSLDVSVEGLLRLWADLDAGLPAPPQMAEAAHHVAELGLQHHQNRG